MRLTRGGVATSSLLPALAHPRPPPHVVHHKQRRTQRTPLTPCKRCFTSLPITFLWCHLHKLSARSHTCHRPSLHSTTFIPSPPAAPVSHRSFSITNHPRPSIPSPPSFSSPPPLPPRPRPPEPQSAPPVDRSNLPTRVRLLLNIRDSNTFTSISSLADNYRNIVARLPSQRSTTLPIMTSLSDLHQWMALATVTELDYCFLVYHYCRLGELTRAEAMVREMTRTRGLTPPILIPALLLHHSVSVDSDTDRTRERLKAFIRKVNPSSSSSSISSLLPVDTLRAIVCPYDEPVFSSILFNPASPHPWPVTLRVEQARSSLACYHFLLQEGFLDHTAAADLYLHLMRVLVDARLYVQCRGVYGEMVERGMGASGEGYRLLMTSLLEEDEAIEGVEDEGIWRKRQLVKLKLMTISQQMKSAKVDITGQHRLLLIRACARVRDVRHALLYYRQMQDEDKLTSFPSLQLSLVSLPLSVDSRRLILHDMQLAMERDGSALPILIDSLTRRKDLTTVVDLLRAGHDNDINTLSRLYDLALSAAAELKSREVVDELKAWKASREGVAIAAPCALHWGEGCSSAGCSLSHVRYSTAFAYLVNSQEVKWWMLRWQSDRFLPRLFSLPLQHTDDDQIAATIPLPSDPRTLTRIRGEGSELLQVIRRASGLDDDQLVMKEGKEGRPWVNVLVRGKREQVDVVLESVFWLMEERKDEEGGPSVADELQSHLRQFQAARKSTEGGGATFLALQSRFLPTPSSPPHPSQQATTTQLNPPPSQPISNDPLPSPLAPSPTSSPSLTSELFNTNPLSPCSAHWLPDGCHTSRCSLSHLLYSQAWCQHLVTRPVQWKHVRKVSTVFLPRLSFDPYPDQSSLPLSSCFIASFPIPRDPAVVERVKRGLIAVEGSTGLKEGMGWKMGDGGDQLGKEVWIVISVRGAREQVDVALDTMFWLMERGHERTRLTKAQELKQIEVHLKGFIAKGKKVKREGKSDSFFALQWRTLPQPILPVL